MSDVIATPGVHDFSFQTGTWRVIHRKLMQRLAGTTSWQEFEGQCRAWEFMQGEGNLDDHYLIDPCGAHMGASLRRFDARSGLWSIWWWDSRKSDIGPPVIGCFDNGVGTFFGEDTYNDRPIMVRYIWSKITSKSAQWEQAFSADAGVNWETNWIMTFERT